MGISISGRNRSNWFWANGVVSEDLENVHEMSQDNVIDQLPDGKLYVCMSVCLSVHVTVCLCVSKITNSAAY